MGNPPRIPAGLGHQTPGADISTIRRGDRVTILDEHGETAIQVSTVKPTRPGTIYLSGAELNRRGKPYLHSGRGLYLSGPAGGTWDWFWRRKPAKPGHTGRHRLIQTQGDNAAVYRVARYCNASARITVAPDATVRADVFRHPSVELIVHPDGRWTLQHRSPDPRAKPVLLASGHVDQDGR